MRLIHRSAPNTTRCTRMGLNVCYVAPDAIQYTTADTNPVPLCLVAGTWSTTR
ncbi:hypothetical protein Acsp03_23090 [Actinomadura sp. NBRC 104412]|nr:hypothetical protein Acsp03_23090 [Actinomadura sp. NBRC 104412]